jgi:hypothetical protein
MLTVKYLVEKCRYDCRFSTFGNNIVVTAVIFNSLANISYKGGFGRDKQRVYR